MSSSEVNQDRTQNKEQPKTEAISDSYYDRYRGSWFSSSTGLLVPAPSVVSKS